MKHSKFVAVLLVIAFTFGSLSTAFSFTDNTTIQQYDYAKTTSSTKPAQSQ